LDSLIAGDFASDSRLHDESAHGTAATPAMRARNQRRVCGEDMRVMKGYSANATGSRESKLKSNSKGILQIGRWLISR
jgi:hypothetical protein